MGVLQRFRWFLYYFGFMKVPMIGYLHPRLFEINDEKIVIKIPLRRRSRNHLNSMYFGALAVGADLAGGLHAYYFARREKLNLSLAFKSFQAQFLRRPEGDVFFICTMGKEIEAMINDAQHSGKRITRPVQVSAFVDYPPSAEKIAEFILELSLKIIP